MKKLLLLISILSALCLAATVGWDNRNFIADSFQFTGGSVRTNFGQTILSSNTTAVSSNDHSTPQLLMSYTITAGSLTVGQTLIMDAGYEWGADAGTPIMGVQLGATGVFPGGLSLWEYGSSNGFTMGFRTVVTRTDSTHLWVSLTPSCDQGEGAQSCIGATVNVTPNFALDYVFSFYGYTPGGGSSDFVKQWFLNVYKIPVVN